MAQTHTLLCTAQPLKTATTYLGLLNGDATQKLLIRRVGFLNVQTVAVTATQTHEIDLYHRTTASWTPGSAVTPFLHDTTNSALTAATTGYGESAAWSGGTATKLREVWWDGTRPTGNGVKWYDWECIVPYGIVWDLAYGISGTMDPLRLNEDEGFYVRGVGGGVPSCLIDVWCEFTNET